MNRFTGKIVAITGGSNGLGSNIVSRMSNEGALVFILDIDTCNGNKISYQLSKEGKQVKFVNVDVSNNIQVQSAISEIIDQHGSVCFQAKGMRAKSWDWLLLVTPML